MLNNSFLLDTCAVISISNNETIAKQAQTMIAEAIDGGDPVFVSPISAWEIGRLVSRGRINLPMTAARWFERLMQAPGLRLAALRPDVRIASSSLPEHPPRDPADRIIVRTAREHDVSVVTRDRLVLADAEQGYCRALAC